MKITYILPHSSQAVGLSEENFINSGHFSFTYCKIMKEFGHETELLKLGQIKKIKHNFTQFPISYGDKFGKEFSLSLYRYIDELDTDIVHIHGYRLWNIIPILFILHRRKIPIIVQHHGGGYNYSKLKVRLFYKILKSFLSFSDMILAVNLIEIDNLKRAGIPKSKLRHIPVGIDCASFFPESQKESRKKLNLSTGKIYILYVGRIVFSKGIDYLIKSIDILKSKYPDITLLIIGDGPELQKLKTLVESLGITERIKFLGYINMPEILRAYYNAADICVLPSLGEGLSSVVLEALACKRPMVGTIKIAGGLLKNEEHALLVETRSPEQISKKISEFLDHPKLCNEVSNKGYDLVVNNFDKNKMAEKLSKIYYEVIYNLKVNHQ